MARRTLSEPFSFQRISFPIIIINGSEGLLRSPESLSSFKIGVLMLRLCPLPAMLPLTLHLLFVDVLAHLTGVFLRRFTLGEECGMLDIW